MYLQKYMVLAGWLMLLWGCDSAENKEKEEAAALTSETGNGLEYATTFTLEKKENYTLVTIPEPWQGASGPAEYYLVPRNADVPPSLEGKNVIRTPVRSVATLSTTYIPMLDLLGEVGTIRAFPDTALVATPSFRRAAMAGQVADLGTGTRIDRELLLEAEPEVVFGFGISEPSSIERVLQAAGHAMVYNTDFLEKHPLGRAEWIKFFGAFYDKEAEADSIFSGVRSRYAKLVSAVGNSQVRPTVFASNMYGDVWFMPGGESWVATFVKDAGGEYLWKDSEGTGSLKLSYETVLEKAQTGDIWLNASNFNTLQAMKAADTRYTHFESWKKGEVYSPLAAGEASKGNLYYEVGYARPDLVLEDLIRILHPGTLPEGQYHFYEKLPAN